MSKGVIDGFLAGLAHRHGAQLATFDRRISAAALTLPTEIRQIAS